jgi:hypothetical protein
MIPVELPTPQNDVDLSPVFSRVKGWGSDQVRHGEYTAVDGMLT